MNLKQAGKIAIASVLFLSSCKVKIVFPSPIPELSAPPVEGDNIAPSLEITADEVVVDSIIPSGVCAITDTKEKVDCFNNRGELISRIQIPGFLSSDPQGLHFAGAADPGKIPPVVFFSFSPDQSLIKSENGIVTSLRKTKTFLAMAGMPGKPIIAFSDMVFKNYTSHSFLYAGSLSTLDRSDPIFELIDSKMNLVLMPIAVEALGAQPEKVWYTHSAWEISGEERIFPINSGLYVFNQNTEQNSIALDADRNLQGLSPDKSLAASVDLDFNGDHSMRVTNLLTGSAINFPLNPENDRGAGNAVFSIDGEYAAWVEVGGSMIAGPPDLKIRIRIGSIATGSVIQELDSTMASKALGWEWVSSMKPVGWLNSQTLIVELHEGNPKTAALMKYEIANGDLQFLCNGSFAGFSYP